MQMEKPLLRVVITVHSVLRQFHISNLVFNICLYVTMDFRLPGQNGGLLTWMHF